MKTNTPDSTVTANISTRRRRRLAPIAFLLGASVVCVPQSLWGQQTISGISTSGKTQTTLGGGGGSPISVNTSTTAGANAFNDFNKFDVNIGEVVNMYLPNGTSNLINIIRDSKASEINGQVNAIKNSKIGGNLFFANANGIVVGQTGAIHAGSITLLTPTKKFINDLTDSTKITAAGDAFTDGTVPISESGVITIKGKLYALENAILKGQTVEINGAQIMTGQAAVDQLKNLTNLGGIDAGTGLSVSSDGTVEIVATKTRDITSLASLADSSKAEAKVDIVGSDITSGKITLKAETDLTTHVAGGASQASINVDNGSKLTAKNGDITIAATAKSTAEFDLEKVAIVGGSTVGDVVGFLKGKLDDFGLSLDGAYAEANAQATVNVGGTLSSGTGNVAISSDATASTKLGVTDGENLGVAFGRASAVAETNILSTARIAGADVSIKSNVTNTNEVSSKAAPGDKKEGEDEGQGGGIDVPVAIAVAIGDTDSSALVNIAGGAEITATGNIVLASDVKDSITVSSQSGTDENGTVALTVALSIGDSTSTVTSAGMLSGKDISATASNETTSNSISAEAGVTIATTKKEKSFVDKVKDLKDDPTGIFKLFDKKAEDNGVMQDDAVQNNAQPSGGDNSKSPLFNGSIAGTLAYSELDRSATVNIGGSASATAGNVVLHSTVADTPIVKAIGNIKVDDSNSTGLAIAGAVALSFYEYTSDAYVADGAVISSSGNVEIKADALISQDNRLDDLFKDGWDFISDTVPGELGNLNLDFSDKFGITGVVDGLKDNPFTSFKGLNSRVQSQVGQKNANGSTKADGAGTVDHFSISSKARARVGVGATITSGNNVSVEAKNLVNTLHLAGEYNKNAGSSYVGAGGSYFGLNYDNDSYAYIADGAVVSAKTVKVDAFTEGKNLSIAAAGGMSKALFGINGSVSIVNIDNTTLAGVSNTAQITTTAADANQDGVVVHAKDYTLNIAIAGALAKADGAAIGVSVSLNHINRNTMSVIASAIFDSGNLFKNIDFTKTAGTGFLDVANGNVNVSGENAGANHAYSLAGGVVWKSNDQAQGTGGSSASVKEGAAMGSNTSTSASITSGTSSASKDTTNINPDSSSQPPKASFGIGISGDVSINLLSDKVIAQISNAKITTKTAQGNVSVKADNTTKSYSVAGSFSIAKGNNENKVSLGLAGSVAYNEISNSETTAKISGSLIDSLGDVKVHAVNTSSIYTLAASGAGAVNSSGFSGSLAGAVTINFVDTDTQAVIADSEIKGASGKTLSAKAEDNSTIGAIAGSVAFSKNSESASVSLGADVAFNRITDNTKASINNVVVHNPLSTLGAEAVNTARIYAGAGAVSVSLGKGFAGAGSFAYNQIGQSSLSLLSEGLNDTGTNSTFAEITNVRGASGALEVGTLVLQAEQGGFIYAGAGAVSVSVNDSSVAAGAAWLHNSIGSATEILLGEGTNLKLTGNANTTLSARNKSRIYGGAIAVGVSTGLAGISGSVATNTIGNVTRSTVSGKLESSKVLIIEATDDAAIYGGAGAVGIGIGKGAVGIALSVNYIKNVTEAGIIGPNASVSGSSVTVSATSLAQIATLAIGGAGAGEIAVGASGTGNVIDSETLATVSGGATVASMAQMDVLATDKSTIYSAAGSVGAAGTGAGAGAAAYNTIGGKTQASIAGSGTTVNAGKLNVKAGSADNSSGLASYLEQGIRSAAVAGSGAGTVGVAGSLTINTMNRNIVSEISNGAVVTTTGAVLVDAHDGSTIMSLAGAASGAGTAAIAGAFAYNTINGEVNALITGTDTNVSAAKVNVEAAASAEIKSIAISGSGAGTVSGAASGAYNAIGTTLLDQLKGAVTDTFNPNSQSITKGTALRKVRAVIADGAVVTSTGADALVLSAKDSSSIWAIVGTGSGSGTFTASGSIVYNHISGVVEAAIDGAKTVTAKGLDIDARSEASILSLAVDGSGSGVATATGTITINVIDEARLIRAGILNGAKVNLGSGAADLLASDKSIIFSLAINGTGSGAFSAGAAVSANFVGGNVESLVYGAGTELTAGKVTINATTDFDLNLVQGAVSAVAGEGLENSTVKVDDFINGFVDGNIYSAAIAGNGSGGVALAGAVTLNRMTRNVTSGIENAKVILTGALDIDATDSSKIYSAAGAFNGAGAAAIAGAFAYNTVNGEVLAKISGTTAEVSATKIDINATASGSIRSVAASGSGAGAASGAASGAYNAIGTTLLDQLKGAVTDTFNPNSQSITKGTALRKVRAVIADGAVVTSTGSDALVLNAKDSSSIWAIVGTGSGSGAFTMSGSIVYNHISGVVEAAVDGAKTVTAKGLDIDASSDASIISLAVDGSGSGAVTLTGTVTINVIDEARLIRAGILNGAKVNLGSGNADLLAVDKSVILSLAINGTGSGAVSAGAAVSANFIGGSIESMVSGTGTEVTAGKLALEATTAFDANIVNNAIQTFSDDSDLTGNGTVSDLDSYLNKIASGNIYSASIAGNGSGGVAVAGAVTVNRITRNVTSGIENAKVTLSDALSVKSTDSARIYSAAGAVNGAGVAAIAGAMSYNEIQGKTQAVIQGDSTVVSAKSISLDASSTAAITSAAVSGTGAGVFAGAVNVSYNTLKGEIAAIIKGSSALPQIKTTGGSTNLKAQDQSTINTGALTITGAGAVAVGGTTLYNNIYTKTTAQIEKAKIESSNDVNVEAISQATINTAGASAAVSLGVSVSGLTIVNNLKSITKANIGNGADVLAQGNVQISAVRTGTINLTNGSAALSLFGSIGGTALINIVGGETEASITGSTTKVSALAANGSAIVYDSGQSAKGVVVKASSTNTITSYTGGVSASGGLTAAIAAIVNSLEGSTKALIADASINQATGANSNQSIAVFAQDTTTITDYAAQVAGGLVSFGGLSDNIFITKTTEAGVTNAKVSAKNKIDVRAVSKDTVKSYLGSVSVGLVSGAINVAVIDSASTTKAYIIGGTTTSEGSLNVYANSTSSVEMGQISGSAGWGAVGAGIGLAEIRNSTSSAAGGTINVKNTTRVEAKSVESITNNLASGAIGVLGGAASVGINTIRSTTSAGINASAAVNQDSAYQTAAQSIEIVADNSATITDNIGAAAVGIVSAGGAVGVDTIKTSVNATIGNNARVNAGNNISVSATGAKTLNSQAVSGSGGLITGSGAVIIGTLGGAGSIDSSKLGDTKSAITGALGQDSFSDYLSSSDATAIKNKRNAAGTLEVFSNNTSNGTTASTGTGSVVNAGLVSSGTTGNISVSATDTVKATVTVGSFSAGLASAGAGYGNVYIKNTTTAVIGGTLSAKGAIAAKATTTNQDSLVQAAGGMVSALGGVAIYASIVDYSTTDAHIADNTVINKAGSVTVGAQQSILNQKAYAGMDGYGIATTGYANAISTSDTLVLGYVGKKAKLGTEATKLGAVSVEARGDYIYRAEAKGISAGFAAGSSNSSKAQARYDIRAYVDDETAIYSSGNFSLKGMGYADAIALTHAISAGAVAIGNNNAEAIIAPRVYAGINKLVNINASAIDVSARQQFKTSTEGWGGAVAYVAGSANGAGTITTSTANARVERLSNNPYTTRVLIGDNATLAASGNVSISAYADDHVFADAKLDSSFSAISNSNLRANAFVYDRVLDILINKAAINGNNVTIKTTDYAWFKASAVIGSSVNLLNSRGSATASGGVRQLNNQYSGTVNKIQVGDGAVLEAVKDLVINAESQVTGRVKAEMYSNFQLTAKNTTNADSVYYSDPTIEIGNADLTAQNISITAQNTGINVQTEAYTKVDFSGSTSNEAIATFNGRSTPSITFKNGAYVAATDKLNVSALVSGINLRTWSDSKIAGVTGSTYAKSHAQLDSSPLIDVQTGAELYGKRIVFTADAGLDTANNHQSASAASNTVVNWVWEKVGEKVVRVFANIICFGGLFCNPETIVEAVYGWVKYTFNTGADTDYTGAGLNNIVTQININGIVSSAETQGNKQLVIDSNGNAAAGSNIGFTRNGSDITVNDIVDNNEAYIHLYAKGKGSKLTGSGKVEFDMGIDSITIDNQSSYNMTIGDIKMLNSGQNTAYLIFDAENMAATNGNFTPYYNYLQTPKAPVTRTVDIRNSGAAGNLTLSKLIDNYIGVTRIDAGNGSLIVGAGKVVDSATWHIITHELYLTAANGGIGTSTNPLAVLFNDLRSDSVLTEFAVLEANALGDINLKLQVDKSKCMSCPDEASVLSMTEIKTLGELNMELLQGGLNYTGWDGTMKTIVVSYEADYSTFPPTLKPITAEVPDYSPEHYGPMKDTSKPSVYKLGTVTIGGDINIAANNQKIVVDGLVTSGLAQLIGSFDSSGNFSTTDYYDYKTTTTGTSVSLENFQQKGGHITITDASAVVGNGTLKVLDGYVKLDITNNSTRELILNNINLEPRVDGSITINGSSRGITGNYGTITLANHGFETGLVNVSSKGALVVAGEIRNASGLVSLTAATNIMGRNAAHLVRAGTLGLTATGGNIGSNQSDNKLRIQVPGIVTATASGNIGLYSVNETLTAGQIKSTSGDINITGDKGIVSDADPAHRLQSSNLTLLAKDGNIDVRTAVNTAKSVIAEKGNVTIAETDAILLELVRSDLGSITVSNAASSITLKSVSATQNVSIQAAGSVSGVGSTHLVAAGSQLMLSAGNGTIESDQGNGLLRISATGVTSASATQNIGLYSVAKNLTAGEIAGSNVTLASEKGIVDDGSNSTRIRANALGLTASDGVINVQTAATSITSLSSGSTTINEFDSVELVSVKTTSGAIVVNAGGVLTATLVQSLADTGNNGITLTTTTGDIKVGRVLAGSAANDLVLTAAGNITSLAGNHLQGDNATLIAGGYIEQTNTQLNTVTASATAGKIYLNEQDAITLTSVTTTAGAIEVIAGGTITATLVQSLADTGNNGITLTTTTGDIKVGRVLAGSAANDLVLTAAGNITSLAGNHLQGDNATLIAGGYIEQTNTQLNTVTASATAGKIYLNEQDAITLTSVTTTTGAIEVIAGGTITATLVQSLADTGSNGITLTTTTGDIKVGQVLAGTTANDLILTAAGSITSLAGNHLQGDNATLIAGGYIEQTNTQLNTVTASATAGKIYLNEQDAITLTSVTTTTGAIEVIAGGTITATLVQSLADTGNNGITLTTTTGDIKVGQVLAGSAANDLVLTAAGNITSLAGNHLQGDNATLIAGGYIEQTNTQLNTVTASATAGKIYLNEQDAITLTSVTTTGAIEVIAGGTITATLVQSLADTGNNGITLTTTTGDIKVGQVLAGTTANDLVLTAAGNITSLAGNHLQGDNATLVAGGYIEQTNTQLNTVTASATAGKIYLNEQDAITLTSVTTTGAIEVIAGGTIAATLVQSLADTGSNGITLTTTAGDIKVGQVLAGTTANDLVLTAAGNITSLAGNHLQGDNATLVAGGYIEQTNTQLNTVTASATAGKIYLNEQDAITLTNITTTDGAIEVIAGGTITATLVQSLADTGSNGITLTTSAGNIELGQVLAGIVGNDIFLTSAGSISSLGSIHLQGDEATLSAEGSIQLLNTQLNRLNALVRGGDIEVREQDDLNVGRLENTAQGAWIDILAGVIQKGQITVLAGEGGVASNNGLITFTSRNEGIQINDTVVSTGGNISFRAAKDIGQGAQGHIDTGNGRILAVTDGSYVQIDGATVNAGSGTIAINAGQDIRLSNLHTENNTANAIHLTAFNGGIYDNGDAHVDIHADAENAVVTLSAKAGIGVGNALEMQVRNLALEVTGAGDIDIDNNRSLHVISSVTYSGHQHIAATGDTYIDHMLVGSSDGTSLHDGAVLAREGDLYLKDLEAKNGDLLLAAEYSILNQAPKAVLRARNISFTAHQGSIGPSDGIFNADVLATLELFANKEINFDQTSPDGDLVIGRAISKSGSITMNAPRNIIADTIVAADTITLIANGDTIQVQKLGGREPYTHLMDQRHADYLNLVDVDNTYPSVYADASPREVFMHVIGADGRITLDTLKVRDLVQAFADHSYARQVYVESSDGQAEFRIAGRGQGLNGDRMDTIDWTIKGGSRLDFTKYWSRLGALRTDCADLMIHDGWTQRSDIWHAQTYLIAENYLHTVQGGDAQIYSPTERFWLYMQDREIFTDAYYVNYRDQRVVEDKYGNENSLVRLGRKENTVHKRVSDDHHRAVQIIGAGMTNLGEEPGSLIIIRESARYQTTSQNPQSAQVSPDREIDIPEEVKSLEKPVPASSTYTASL